MHRTFQVSTAGKHIEIIRNKLNLEERQYLPHYWTNEGFKGTVVNRAFPGSFEITLIQSLKRWTFEGKYFSVFYKFQFVKTNISWALLLKNQFSESTGRLSHLFLFRQMFKGFCYETNNLNGGIEIGFLFFLR